MPRRDSVDWLYWGRLVRRARRGMGLTGEQVATQVGVVRKTIANIEAGRHKPASSIVIKVCTALGMPWPWPGAVVIPLDGVRLDEALEVLRCALRAHATEREDPIAYVRAPHEGTDGVEHSLLVHRVSRDADVATALLAALSDAVKIADD